MNEIKESLKETFLAGVKAVAPDQALMSHVSFDSGTSILACGAGTYNLDSGRVYVVGAGKGVAPMAKAIENLLGNRIDKGFVVAKKGHELPLDLIAAGSASHPVPDEAGVEAAGKILELAGELGPDDLLICLLTGGASALTTRPAQGLTLADLQKTTALLLGSGADIAEINALRKHLSTFGGGRLAQAANGAKVLTLIVSDVIGDDIGTIASGPTAPDTTTYADCMAIIEKYQLENKLPPTVLKVIRGGLAGQVGETPKPDAVFFQSVQNVLVATNAQAIAACAAKAKDMGFEPMIVPAPMQGEAIKAADAICGQAMALQSTAAARPFCLLAGGETTVTLPDNPPPGGRNQEMALAAALRLDGAPGIYALFASTDGNDGPTDAAGGYAVPDSLTKLGGRDNAFVSLKRHNANAALIKSGDIFRTGPTLTNVMDLAVVIVCMGACPR